MQVRDVMTRNVISIGADQPILKAIRLMLQNDISGLPVVDANGVRSDGRNIGEIMTGDPLFVSEDDTLETVVELMERHHIKRLPVLRDGKMTGIVSRANLMHALVRLDSIVEVPSGGDADIRERVLAAFAKQAWAPEVRIAVKDGVVELEGTIMDDRERQACIVVAENVPGVKQVRDHLVWVEPMSGAAFASPEDQEKTVAPISPISTIA